MIYDVSFGRKSFFNIIEILCILYENLGHVVAVLNLILSQCEDLETPCIIFEVGWPMNLGCVAIKLLLFLNTQAFLNLHSFLIYVFPISLFKVFHSFCGIEKHIL